MPRSAMVWSNTSSRASRWLPAMISPILGASTSIAAIVLPFVLRLQVDAAFRVRHGFRR